MYRRGRLIPTYGPPSPPSEGRAACAVRTPLPIVWGFALDTLPEACSPFTKTSTGILSHSGHTGPSSPLARLPISPSDDQHLQIQGSLFWPRCVCVGGDEWSSTSRPNTSATLTTCSLCAAVSAPQNSALKYQRPQTAKP